MKGAPLKNITQVEFEKLIRETFDEKKIKLPPLPSLKVILNKNGFSHELVNIKFSIPGITISQPPGIGVQVIHGNERLKNVDYSGIKFSKCKLDGANLSGSTFNGSTFKNCVFNKSVMEKCSIQKTNFETCKFDSCLFPRTRFGGETKFNDCVLKNADFYKANFANQVKFINSKVSDSVFINAVDGGVQCSNTTFKDCVIPNNENSQVSKKFFKNTKNVQSDPPKAVIGILWGTQFPGFAGTKCYERLRKNGAIPVRISYTADDEVNTEELSSEVKEVLTDYEDKVRKGEKQKKSRAMCILDNDIDNKSTNTKTIIERAKGYSKYLDGILLPGGPDIPSELYGQAPDSRAEPESNYVRSILEFAMIRAQRDRGNPMMGICRGCQITNVFYGGDMIQRVAEQGNYESIRSIKAKPGTSGIVSDLMKSPVRGMSVHHQAIDHVAKNLSEGEQLEVVAIYNGVVKAVQERHGAPVILTQFHPEFYNDKIKKIYQSKKGGVIKKSLTATTAFIGNILSKNNDNFIPAFIGAAEHNKKQQAIIVKEFKKTGNNNDLMKRLRKPRLSDNSQKIRSIVSHYRKKQEEKSRKILKGLTFFKKPALSFLRFLDKKIFYRNEEVLIAKLQTVDSSLAIKMMNRFSDKYKTSLFSKIFNESDFREKNEALNKKDDRSIDQIIQDFIETHPDMHFTKKLQENGTNLPKSYEQLMKVISSQTQYSEKVKNELLNSSLGEKLERLKSPDNKLSIDEIHLKYTKSIAEQLQGGRGYSEYNELLSRHLKDNRGNYPKTREKWNDFKNSFSKEHLLEPVITKFIFEIDQSFKSIEEMEKSINATPKEQQNKLKKIAHEYNKIVGKMMHGPYEMSAVISKYVERFNQLPVSDESWNQFKRELNVSLDGYTKDLIKNIDNLHQDRRNALKDKFRVFLKSHPEDFFSKVLLDYEQNHQSLPLTQNEWSEFTKLYTSKSEDLIINEDVAELLVTIYEKEQLAIKTAPYSEMPSSHILKNENHEKICEGVRIRAITPHKNRLNLNLEKVKKESKKNRENKGKLKKF